jgi:CHAT domain-containing protein
VVRYAPSATALGHAAQTAATAGAERLLAIDEPAVAGAGRLPNSAREVAAVAGHFTAPTLLAHAAATRTAVLAQLADAQVVHFSCHGANDWGDPLASGLFMAGGELLTVADVLALRLGGARLATLSACETGIPGSKLPDEAVMLPSALLQAGYAGVAASLWTVSDISTAMLMAYFYKLWRDDGVDPPAALVLAQRWLRDSSNGEKQAFFAGYAPELASELKMGMAMAVEFFVAVRKQGLVEERSFAAPYHWAAFYFTGA